jgi:hypothetical protein
LRPDAIVHFGVASSATGFRIETRAVNEASPAADCDGCLPAGHYVRRGGPPVLASTLPNGLIFRRLKQAGVAVSMSRDAGRYLCNATLYNSLLLARSLPQRPLVGFVHIPALAPENEDPASRRQWAELRLGLSVILSTVSEVLRSETARTGVPRPNRLRRALVCEKVLRHDHRASRVFGGWRLGCRSGGAAYARGSCPAGARWTQRDGFQRRAE